MASPTRRRNRCALEVQGIGSLHAERPLRMMRRLPGSGAREAAKDSTQYSTLDSTFPLLIPSDP